VKDSPRGKGLEGNAQPLWGRSPGNNSLGLLVFQIPARIGSGKNFPGPFKAAGGKRANGIFPGRAKGGPPDIGFYLAGFLKNTLQRGGTAIEIFPPKVVCPHPMWVEKVFGAPTCDVR